MSQPKKWYQVYPQGTEAGIEEQKFFRALARHPKFDWRSAAAIAADTHLSVKRVEEIIAKYYKQGIVLQSPKNDDQWGYWELHPKLLAKKPDSISTSDGKARIKDALSKAGIKLPTTKKSSAKKPSAGSSSP